MKRFLPILLFTVLFGLGAEAQSSRTAPTSENTDRIVKTYPNPASTSITFDLQKGYTRGMSVQVFSFVGKRMAEITNVPQKYTLDLGEYNRGMYMYHLVDASGRVIESGKFQVTK